VEKPTLVYAFYNAGWCFFEGLFEQEFAVKFEIEECFIPQYLQVYCDFSLPSYNSCFLPSGFLVQEFAVKFETLECLVPHHLQ
jgi:hypothetical protein